MRAASTMSRVRRRLDLVGRLGETWIRRPRSPNRLVVDVTRRCNLRCHMCRTWARRPQPEMSPQDYRHLFRGLQRLTWLDLTGGEPFVRRDIDDVFAAAIDETPSLRMLHFQTNGWNTDRIVHGTHRARTRGSHYDLVVTVSIDGPPPVHDAIRGRPGSYDRAIATARAIESVQDVDVHIGTTLGPRNENAVEDLFEALTRDLPGFTPRRWHLNQAARGSHFFANDDVDDLEPGPHAHFDAHLRRRGLPRSMVELMESLYLLHLHRYQRDGRRPVPCQALRSTAFLSPEGDVYPCHLYDRPLGNVLADGFDRVWNSDVVDDARRDVERLACGGCFSACEAYPALAGAPLRALARTPGPLWRHLGSGS